MKGGSEAVKATFKKPGRIRFKLSKNVLAETEMKVLAKGLNFLSIQKHLKEPELKQDFQQFSGKIRCKWHLDNRLFEHFSYTLLSPESCEAFLSRPEE